MRAKRVLGPSSNGFKFKEHGTQSADVYYYLPNYFLHKYLIEIECLFDCINRKTNFCCISQHTFESTMSYLQGFMGLSR